MNKDGRPITIIAACAAIVIVTAATLFYGLQRPAPEEAYISVYIAVFVWIGLGILIAAVIWAGKGWGRWIYVFWLLVPFVFGSLAESRILEKDLSDLFVLKASNRLTSWDGILDITAVVLLFLPVSNRWISQCR